MKRENIIIAIWKYGFKNPSFHIDNLKYYLKKKGAKYDDINFGLAYVERCFIKNEYLNEYLIDPNSIANYLSNRQRILSIKAFIFTIIISTTTLAVSIGTYYKTTKAPNDSDAFHKLDCETDVIASDDTLLTYVPNVLLMNKAIETYQYKEKD